MTFEVPESKHIDIEALKRQMRSYLEFILSMPNISAKEQDADESHIFDCFDGGGWAEDPRSAHEISDELYKGRANTRPMVETW